jgi:hypothetical protein
MLAVSVLTCWSGGAFGQEKWQESWEERCSSENEPDDCWAGKASRAETPKELRGICCQDQKNRDRDVKSKKMDWGCGTYRSKRMDGMETGCVPLEVKNQGKDVWTIKEYCRQIDAGHWFQTRQYAKAGNYLFVKECKDDVCPIKPGCWLNPTGVMYCEFKVIPGPPLPGYKP